MRLVQVAARLLINVWALFLARPPRSQKEHGKARGRQAEEPLVPAGASLYPDLTYSTPAPGVRLQLDLARPVGRGPFPVVVFIHGGGWVVGDRKVYHPYMARAVRQGYAAVAVSYRLGPGHPFPAALHDVQHAVRWLRANAAAHALDPERIGVVGYSAGGNLACLLGAARGRPRCKVRAVVSWYGLMDLKALYDSCVGGELGLAGQLKMRLALRSYLGGGPEEVGPCYAAASPVTRAGRGTAPTLLIHGTADELVPCRQSELMARKLKEAGAEVSLLKVEGARHDFVGGPEDEALAVMFRFLDRRLKGP